MMYFVVSVMSSHLPSVEVDSSHAKTPDAAAKVNEGDQDGAADDEGQNSLCGGALNRQRYPMCSS